MEYLYKNISGATAFKNIKLHVTKNENDIITSTNTRDDLAMKLPSEVLSTIPVYQNWVSSIAIYASTSVQDMIDAIATSIHFKKELLISGHSIDSLNMTPLLQEVYLISHACRLTDNNSELIEHALKQLKQAVHSAFVSIESAIFFASTLFNIVHRSAIAGCVKSRFWIMEGSNATLFSVHADLSLWINAKSTSFIWSYSDLSFSKRLCC